MSNGKNMSLVGFFKDHNIRGAFICHLVECSIVWLLLYLLTVFQVSRSYIFLVLTMLYNVDPIQSNYKYIQYQTIKKNHEQIDR